MKLGAQKKMSLGAQWRILVEAKKRISGSESQLDELKELAGRLGVEVRERRFFGEIDGTLNCDGDTFLIAISAGHPPDRKKRTLALGLGYYMLDRRLFKCGVRIREGGHFKCGDSGPDLFTPILASTQRRVNTFARNIDPDPPELRNLGIASGSDNAGPSFGAGA